ncbi:MAG: hypothetical protein H0U97_09740 [Gammaproteobacteria bacterium]|nr:hypothetical protein [Gammaproteobacteria bacterium]
MTSAWDKDRVKATIAPLVLHLDASFRTLGERIGEFLADRAGPIARHGHKLQLYNMLRGHAGEERPEREVLRHHHRDAVVLLGDELEPVVERKRLDLWPRPARWPGRRILRKAGSPGSQPEAWLDRPVSGAGAWSEPATPAS